MKRVILSAAIASALAVAASAIPQEKPMDPAQQPEARQSTSQAQATTIKGSVVSVDQSGKSFIVKDEASAKEVTVYWDSATKVNGDLKPGSMVALQTTDQGGKMMATSIDIKSAKKPY